MLVAHIPILLYFVPQLIFIHNGKAFWIAYVSGYLGALLMFNWKVSVGEEGSILIFGFDTGWRVGPGNYPSPAIFPFLRGFHVVVGVSVEVPSKHHEGNTTNIKHWFDQRFPSVRINVQSGRFAALLGALFTNILIFLWDVFEPNGKLKYGKVGAYVYFGTWIYVLLAR